MLDPALGDTSAQATRWRAALTAMDQDPTQVAAMSVFTTQSATTVSRAVAADVQSRDYALTSPMTCVQLSGYRQCDGPLTVMDYRNADHIVPPDSDGSPLGSYDLPMRVWLPDTGQAPYPVVLCGHGLGGSKADCEELAQMVSDRGVAVVAVDAVEHGDHPGRTDLGIPLIEDFMIFAITLDPPGISAPRLRDNFRQSAWDKLQVVRAIEQGMDVDGDGKNDIDPTHLSYVGVSLGAIMGPEPLALSPDFQGAALVVGGGRISSIIQDSASFGVLVDVMRPPGVDDGEVDRFFPVLQSVIDAGDPMVYGPHVDFQRFADQSEPDVLVMLAYQDQVVPNSSNEAFVRGLGVPGVGTQVWPIPSLDWKDSPLSGNLPQGGTGGLLQFAQVQSVEGGDWETADHSTLHSSVQGRKAIGDFLDALIADQLPIIAEPQRP
jgi:dienelactone hydrolase